MFSYRNTSNSLATLLFIVMDSAGKVSREAFPGRSIEGRRHLGERVLEK